MTVSQTHGASTADDDDVLAEFLAEVNSETVAAVIKESSKSSASSTIAVKNVVNEEDEAEEWETFWDDSRKDFSYYQTDTFEVKHTQFKQRKSISSSPIVPRLSHLLQHVSGQSMTVETESLLISIQTLFQRIKNLIAEEAPGSALQFYAAKLIEESRVFLVRLQDWRNGNLNQDYFCSIFQHWKSQVASIKGK